VGVDEEEKVGAGQLLSSEEVHARERLAGGKLVQRGDTHEVSHEVRHRGLRKARSRQLGPAQRQISRGLLMACLQSFCFVLFY